MTDLLLRMRYDGARVIGEYSTDDGATWTQAGQTAGYPGALRVGVMAIQGTGGNGGVVPFERFALECAPQVAASAPSGTAPFEATFTSSADGAWDFGDGTTGRTGAERQPTPSPSPASTACGRPSGSVTGSTVVTVNPGQAPALPQSDEFSGNELDPKWEVLRPAPHRPPDLRRPPAPPAVRRRHARRRRRPRATSCSRTRRRAAPRPRPRGSTCSGLTATGDQAGLILWRSETPYLNFSKVVYNRRGANHVVGRALQHGGRRGRGHDQHGDRPTCRTHVYIRVNVSADGLVQPERSTDGTTWTAVGGAYSVASHEPLKVGLTFFGANSLRRAAFDYFRVESQGPCDPPPPVPGGRRPRPASPRSGTAARSTAGARPARAPSRSSTTAPPRAAGSTAAAASDCSGTSSPSTTSSSCACSSRPRTTTDNSGVFVRFPNPQADANIPIDQGHEIQIREGVEGDGENQKTGSIYNLDREDARERETGRRVERLRDPVRGRHVHDHASTARS